MHRHSTTRKYECQHLLDGLAAWDRQKYSILDRLMSQHPTPERNLVEELHTTQFKAVSPNPAPSPLSALSPRLLSKF